MPKGAAIPCRPSRLRYRRVEQLSSRFLDGEWHAIFPSAGRTLCLRAAPPRSAGRCWTPTCAVCLRKARAFHSIDPVLPPHWKRITLRP